ncbi:MAG: hypothetical protein LBL39_04650 [Planctomycetaceae bacterium]|nr:hypothetical protein [Planctomycetaceae bacterium]
MASVEDFVKRITRMNRKFTFIFTEDFFDINGKVGVRTDRYLDLRKTFQNVGHKRGDDAILKSRDILLFDVNVCIIRTNFTCMMTDFAELNSGPFGDQAMIYGMGSGMVDAQKAKFAVDSFMVGKMESSITLNVMLAEAKKRQLVLVVEKAADLNRPSLEPIRKLRSQLCTVLINSVKGPVVDCQVSCVFKEGNSSSLSSLLNMFCVHYK